MDVNGWPILNWAGIERLTSGESEPRLDEQRGASAQGDGDPGTETDAEATERLRREFLEDFRV